MKTYRITQYETWTQEYEVEAKSVRDAITKLFTTEEAILVHNSLSYVEINPDVGMPVDELEERFGEELDGDALEGYLDDGYLSTIANIQEIPT